MQSNPTKGFVVLMPICTYKHYTNQHHIIR